MVPSRLTEAAMCHVASGGMVGTPPALLSPSLRTLDPIQRPSLVLSIPQGLPGWLCGGQTEGISSIGLCRGHLHWHICSSGVCCAQCGEDIEGLSSITAQRARLALPNQRSELGDLCQPLLPSFQDQHLHPSCLPPAGVDRINVNVGSATTTTYCS